MAVNNQVKLQEIVVDNGLAGELVQYDGSKLVRVITNSIPVNSILALKKQADGTFVAQVLPDSSEGLFVNSTTPTPGSNLALDSNSKKCAVYGGYSTVSLPAPGGAVADGFQVEVANYTDVTNGSGGDLLLQAVGAHIHNDGGTSLNLGNGDVQRLELSTTPSGTRRWIKRA